MKVLFAASECAPIAKVGGLGDVIGSLPKALFKQGVEIAVALPGYDTPEVKNYPSEPIGEWPVDFADQAEVVTVHQAVLPESTVPLFLLENPTYLSSGGIYLDPSAFALSQAEIERFAFFSRAIVEIFAAANSPFRPQIIHCHDWHTGLIPRLIRRHLPADAATPAAERIRTIFTIHNLANQGFSTLDVADKLDLDLVADKLLAWDAEDDNLDFILQGIIGADYLTTVSTNYAQEITTARFGEGLNEVIKAREGRLVGILNGLDEDFFDPAEDRHLPRKLSVRKEAAEFKAGNKKALQEELNLMVDPAKPLIGMVTRLANQKGIDLVAFNLQKILDLGYQLAILGTGEPALEAVLRSHQTKLGTAKGGKADRGEFAAVLKFDEGAARRIYAGCDLFLIPSRFEPCGLTQMIAMRYGAVPVVRGVGGLKDTVIDISQKDPAASGFVFEDFSATALLEVLARAYQKYQSPGWGDLVQRCLQKDFSWQQSAAKYQKLYQLVLSA